MRYLEIGDLMGSLCLPVLDCQLAQFAFSTLPPIRFALPIETQSSQLVLSKLLPIPLCFLVRSSTG